jgi:diaminopimelate decarboxylase
MPHTEIVFPAALLEIPGAAKWLRELGLCVDVRSYRQIDSALAAGINPVQMVLRSEYAVTRTIWHAVGLGVGRFVVASEGQVLALSACVRRPQPVLVDVTAGPPDELITAVFAQHRLQLTGLHCQLGVDSQADDVNRVIGLMAQFSREHGSSCPG